MRLVSYFSRVAGCSVAEEAGALVMDWEGNLRRHETPSTVAELMLDAPGHMVASAEEVRRTRRALAVRADERLRPGGVYLLFPVDRAGSRVPDRQMAALDGARGAGKRKSRRPAAGKRVFPGLAPGDEEGGEGGKVEEGKRKAVFFSREGEAGGFPGCRRVGVTRQWKPVLETIHESK